MVHIEIDGIPLEVDSTKMIIQAADEAGIDIPRFCYHKKLSIVANCRMCLVEVDKARKALPACATPVTEGMKVFTHSKRAVDAQRGVMEFLLINHPLDCPICDQGGECELQDISIGYGAGVSRFSEGKRVVKDKNIGPLIATDLTRCIHCTRCVRFGEEIAGIKELGATGRGEHMEIGTYIENSVASELSGNIIDLCPVGALTSKPFRYRARAWELTAHPSIAPHDAVGSNIELHTRRNEVMRVVPRDNEAINESWLSDRDRFSYLGLSHEQRLEKPMIKRNGTWQETDWQTALDVAVKGIQSVASKNGPEQVGGLLSPGSTVEEAFLFQKLLRGIGSNNIDHRLRQQDFSDQGPVALALNWCLESIVDNDMILLVGSNIRAEQPIISHHIRQAAMAGSLVTTVNFMSTDLLMPVDKQIVVDSQCMVSVLSDVAKELITFSDKHDAWHELLKDITPCDEAHIIGQQLAGAEKATIFVGALVNNHPQAALYRSLCRLIAELSGSEIVILPAAANNIGASLAGALPHLSAINDQSVESGLNARLMLAEGLKGYLLLGIEPEFDCSNSEQAIKALNSANFVVTMSAFVTETMKSYSDVILPVAAFAETSGTYVSAEGRWQSFTGAIKAPGESRPAWKVLRVMGNLAKIDGFDYVSSQDVRDDVRDQLERASPVEVPIVIPEIISAKSNLMLISEVPMYQCDAVVRRSTALQQTTENERAKQVRINSNEAERYNITQAQDIEIAVDGNVLTVAFEIDNTIADGCIYLASSHGLPMYADVTIKAVG